MKLHPVQRPPLVPDAHDLALLGPRRDDEVGVVERLPPDDQRVALLYYTGDGRAKIEQRQKLAEELGGSNALRIRMHRIRATLHACISECLKETAQ